MDLSLNVKRGAYFLDEVFPEWYQNVRLDLLAMSRGDVCVLGQVANAIEPGYTYDCCVVDADDDIDAFRCDGPDRLADLVITVDEAVERGFCLWNADGSPENWSRLDALWAEAIVERLT